MEIKLKRLIELANEILNVNDRAQKKRGLEKMISELEKDYSEPIKAAKDELDKFKEIGIYFCTYIHNHTNWN